MDLKNPQAQEDFVLCEIGRHLLLVQDLEIFLGAVLKIAYECDIDTIRSKLLAKDRRTLGQLVRELRKKFSVTDAFTDLLGSVLESRNMFVHRIGREFNVRTPAGRDSIVRFLSSSTDKLSDATHVLHAIIVKSSRELGIRDPELEAEWRENGNLSEIENEILPNLSKYIKFTPSKES